MVLKNGLNNTQFMTKIKNMIVNLSNFKKAIFIFIFIILIAFIAVNNRYSTIEDLLPDDAIRNPKDKVKAAFENLEHWKKQSYGIDKFKCETKELIENLCTLIKINN